MSVLVSCQYCDKYIPRRSIRKHLIHAHRSLPSATSKVHPRHESTCGEDGGMVVNRTPDTVNDNLLDVMQDVTLDGLGFGEDEDGWQGIPESGLPHEATTVCNGLPRTDVYPNAGK